MPRHLGRWRNGTRWGRREHWNLEELARWAGMWGPYLGTNRDGGTTGDVTLEVGYLGTYVELPD